MSDRDTTSELRALVERIVSLAKKRGASDPQWKTFHDAATKALG